MRNGLKAPFAVAAAICLVVATPGVASAHYVKQEGPLATWEDNCTIGRSEVSHGGGGGYTRVDTKSRQSDPLTGTRCIWPFDRPAGQIAARYHYYRYSSARKTWLLCKRSAWAYNQRTARDVRISWNFGAVPPCGGNGYFGTIGDSLVLDDGAWHGGQLWSGYHFIPPQSPAVAETVPPPPWVRADGTVDESRLPARIGVAGADGEPLQDGAGRYVTVDPRGTAPDMPGTGGNRGGAREYSVYDPETGQTVLEQRPAPQTPKS